MKNGIGSKVSVPKISIKNPFSKKAEGSAGQFSIRYKLMIPCVLVVMLVCALMVSFLNSESVKSMIAIGADVAEVTAKGVINTISHAMVSKIELEGSLGNNAKSMRDQLKAKAEEYGVQYLYILGTDGTKVYYIVDQEDAVLFDPAKETYEFLKPCFEEALPVQGVDLKSKADGTYAVTAYVPILIGDDVVGVMGCDYDAKEIVAEKNESIRIGLIIAIICIILSIVIIFFVVNSVVKNLKKVDSKVYELASNEGDLTQTIDVKSGDETEDIAGNLNKLLLYVKNIMLNISGNAGRLGEASGNMVQNLQGAQGSVDDVSATMEEMSATMEEIAATMSHVNEAVGDMMDLTKQVFADAHDGVESSDEVKARADRIMADAKREETDAKRRADEMEIRLKEKIEKSGVVKQIESLAEQILNITDQTSLLSLNASIEAARAGEHGRGFSVVAEEIRKLADESSNAAVQIQEVNSVVIASVDELAAESMDMLNFLKDVTNTGYGELVNTGNSYSRDMDDMNNMMHAFAERAQLMQDKVDMITESVSTVNSAIDESAHGIANVSEMAVALAESMAQIGIKAQENEEVAEELGTEVKKFKLQ